MVEGWGGFVMIRKLKVLMEKLKVWIRDVLRDVWVRKAMLLREIELLDKIEESRFLSVDEMDMCSRYIIELEEILVKEEISL